MEMDQDDSLSEDAESEIKDSVQNLEQYQKYGGK